MQAINRMMTNICSSDLVKSKVFYVKLFDFEVVYDSDWFIHLVSKNKKMELGIIDSNNDLVPSEFRTSPNGFYITFVVDSADEIFDLAKAEQVEVLQEPTDTSYGQRRMLLKDPDGALIDVSSLIP